MLPVTVQYEYEYQGSIHVGICSSSTLMIYTEPAINSDRISTDGASRYQLSSAQLSLGTRMYLFCAVTSPLGIMYMYMHPRYRTRWWLLLQLRGPTACPPTQAAARAID